MFMGVFKIIKFYYYLFIFKTHYFTLSIAAVEGNRLKNCLSAASFFKSRQLREAQDSPKGREIGCPFLAPSFRQVKEGDDENRET